MPFRRLFIDTVTASRLDLDAAELAEAERRFNDAASQDRRIILVIVVGGLTMLIGGWTVGLALADGLQTIGVSPGPSTWIASSVTPVTFIAIWFTVFPRLIRRPIRRILRDCGHDVCVRCGYHLVGTDGTAACPECGQRDQPAMGATAPNADAS